MGCLLQDGSGTFSNRWAIMQLLELCWRAEISRAASSSWLLCCEEAGRKKGQAKGHDPAPSHLYRELGTRAAVSAKEERQLLTRLGRRGKPQPIAMEMGIPNHVATSSAVNQGNGDSPAYLYRKHGRVCLHATRQPLRRHLHWHQHTQPASPNRRPRRKERGAASPSRKSASAFEVHDVAMQN